MNILNSTLIFPSSSNVFMDYLFLSSKQIKLVFIAKLYNHAMIQLNDQNAIFSCFNTKQAVMHFGILSHYLKIVRRAQIVKIMSVLTRILFTSYIVNETIIIQII